MSKIKELVAAYNTIAKEIGEKPRKSFRTVTLGEESLAKIQKQRGDLKKDIKEIDKDTKALDREGPKPDSKEKALNEYTNATKLVFFRTEESVRALIKQGKTVKMVEVWGNDRAGDHPEFCVSDETILEASLKRWAKRTESGDCIKEISVDIYPDHEPQAKSAKKGKKPAAKKPTAKKEPAVKKEARPKKIRYTRANALARILKDLKVPTPVSVIQKESDAEYATVNKGKSNPKEAAWYFNNSAPLLVDLHVIKITTEEVEGKKVKMVEVLVK